MTRRHVNPLIGAVSQTPQEKLVTTAPDQGYSINRCLINLESWFLRVRPSPAFLVARQAPEIICNRPPRPGAIRSQMHIEVRPHPVQPMPAAFLLAGLPPAAVVRHKPSRKSPFMKKSAWDMIEPPPEVRDILQSQGTDWTTSQYKTVKEWLQSVEPGSPWLLGRIIAMCRLGAVAGSEDLAELDEDCVRQELDKEVFEAVMAFFEERFKEVIELYDPRTGKSFLAHFGWHLEQSFHIPIPTNVKSILDKTTSRTRDEIDNVKEWVAKRLGGELRSIAYRNRCFLADDGQVDEAVQEFFCHHSGIGYVIKKYDHARGDFCRFLFSCFRRFCWKRAKRLKRIRSVEVPVPKRTDAEGQQVDQEFADQESVSPAEAAEKELDKEYVMALLESCVEQLREDYRKVIKLDSQGLPYAGIAETTGFPIGTVKGYLNRAKHELRRLLHSKGAL